MKLHLTRAEGRYLVTGYGPGWVEINEARHETSLILTPARLIAPWEAGSFDALAAMHFVQVAALAPEVLLIGTGARLRFPHPALLKPLIAAGIGFEVMDTAAACRTYNILMAEGRNVAAALIL
jgi:uncharacterized protein